MYYFSETEMKNILRIFILRILTQKYSSQLGTYNIILY